MSFLSNDKRAYFLKILFISLVLLYFCSFLFKRDYSKRIKSRENFLELYDNFETRDYIRYKCNDIKRIGGEDYMMTNKYSKTHFTDPSHRIDTAWFVCFDGLLAPNNNSCNILSFGINHWESFDDRMNNDFGCNVYSFDPFIEDIRFANIRKNNPHLEKSNVLEVNKKWKFYRIGITGEENEEKDLNQIGGIAKLETILKLTSLTDKIVDIFKIDIEGNEISVFKTLNYDYACKYFKQILIETHSPGSIDNLYLLIKKLEKCFSLFHRDSRLISPDFQGQVVKEATQGTNGFDINLKYFKNEANLCNFLISTGELYFININFLE